MDTMRPSLIMNVTYYVYVSVYGYHEAVTGVQVFTLVTAIICWSGSCALTSLERYVIIKFDNVAQSLNISLI